MSDLGNRQTRGTLQLACDSVNVVNVTLPRLLGKILCLILSGEPPYPRRRTPRGSDCARESDGGDSDGQGTPQGGGGVRSTPPLGPRSGNFTGV